MHSQLPAHRCSDSGLWVVKSTSVISTMADDKYLVYHGLMLPKIVHSEESLKHFETFEFRDDDVLALTYPKSGTTWMQEILPLLMNGGDTSPVKTVPNWDRVPWLEELRAAEVLSSMPSPRIMVSHMPYHLMPKSLFSSKAKVIYVTRNPKDVLVSSFHFHKMASFLDDPGTFDEFLDKFLEGEVMFGKWTDHVKSWQKTYMEDRIFHVTYEEMLKDLKGVLSRMSRFLGKDLSDEILEQVASHCSFKSMKDNAMSNYSLVPQDIMDNTKSPFMRKGIAGDWKKHFNPEQEAKFTDAMKREMRDNCNKITWDED
ncbi:sulfotransferase family cytosolic 2B member 1-like [Denticeps clupeoides]|uniref:Sulfotransferase n=1 Tax=Denticeps clupeoides TaxID=299321 RepID=A0AAY4AWU3_9TELE|nr:sulfotransferase family cytosolic 2B member 1-like [Denticeps clupeoides]